MTQAKKGRSLWKASSSSQLYAINGQHQPVRTANSPKGAITYKRAVTISLPSEFGQFCLFSYQHILTGEIILAIVKGEVAQGKSIPLRLHSSCITGDILGSLRCDCREQLIRALKYIEKKGVGLVIYAFQEGRGIGLTNKLRTYYLQERGLDTVDANLALGLPEDLRTYDFVNSILDDLVVESVALMTNNPDKVRQMKALGVIVEKVIPHEVKPCQANHTYLKTKKERLGHLLSSV